MDFKLYSNESKETITERPFITPLGIAKIQIDQSISQFLSSLKTEDNGSGIRLKLIRNPYQASQSLINEIRLNVKNNNVSVEAFSGLLFSIFREKISATIFEYKKAKEAREAERASQEDDYVDIHDELMMTPMNICMEISMID